MTILIFFLFLAFLAVISSIDTKKAKKIIITADVILLFFVIPVKMKWLAILDALFFLYGIFTTPFPANLVPVVAILNFFLFCGEDLLVMLGVYKKSANTISFQRAAREIRRKQAASLYHHKCAVCGKTDTDYPDMEFRYCSLCQGYHCFCSEHINNHIHFTE